LLVAMPVTAQRAGTRQDRRRYEVRRHRLRDGAETTIYVVRYAAASTRLRIVYFDPPAQLDRWCAANGVEEAMTGGFFTRPDGPALGELWVDGHRFPTRPFIPPHGQRRASVLSDGRGHIRIAARDSLPAQPRGHLLQAGPLLVADGAPVDLAQDPEGFATGAFQFDSDISAGRYPRGAFGLTEDDLVAVVCDGRRSRLDAGLSLSELAALMVELGTEEALNLDGGGSATLVHRGHLVNRVYGDQDFPLLEPRPVRSALLFEPVPLQT
jgi:hypothetical protein